MANNTQLNDNRANFLQNNSDKDNKGLDNDGKNPYISDVNTNTNEPDGDSANADSADLNKVLLEKTFQNDSLKLAEAYRNQTREVSKIIQEKKTFEQDSQRLAALKERAKGDAKLSEILDKLEKGEDYRSLLDSSEPSGKRNVSDTVNKPTNQLTPISEQTLASEGYLDINVKNNVSPVEWARMVADATSMFLPKYIAERSMVELNAKLKEQEVANQKQQLQAEADKRFNESYDRFIANNKVNFAGEHKDLLDEIYETANSYRDPKDKRLPRANAFELAAKEVFESKGLELEQGLAAQRQGQQQQFNSGFNKPHVAEKTGIKKSFAEMRHEQISSRYNKQVNAYGSFRNK